MAELLRTGNAGSVNALALWNAVDWTAWGQMLHSVKTGKTAFRHVHGMEPFAYFEHNPELGALFNNAMTGYAAVGSMAAVTAYDFTNFSTVVDVGGGHGVLMAAILRANPTARGIIFDQANVIEGARKVIAEGVLLQRCDCVAGNFFESVPSGGDAYILASIIHDWDVERSLTILTNCRRVMTGKCREDPDGGSGHSSRRYTIFQQVARPGNAGLFRRMGANRSGISGASNTGRIQADPHRADPHCLEHH